MYRLMYLGTKRCIKVKYFVSLDLALLWLEPGLGCLRSHNLKMRGWGRFLQAARCEWTGEVPSLPRWFKWMRSGGSWGSAKVGWDGDGRYARPGGLATCDSCTPAQSKVTKDTERPRDPETQMPNWSGSQSKVGLEEGFLGAKVASNCTGQSRPRKPTPDETVREAKARRVLVLVLVVARVNIEIRYINVDVTASDPKFQIIKKQRDY